MDEHAKGEVRKHDSWLEDTRHLLEIIQEENKRGPQPPGIIPVTLDISSMYTNVPLEEGLTHSDMALAVFLYPLSMTAKGIYLLMQKKIAL